MTTILTGTIVTTGDTVTLADGDDLYLAPAALRASTDGGGIAALFTGHAIDIFGSVYGNTTGIRLGNLSSGSTFSTLTIGEGASVVSRNTAVSTLGNSISFANYGTTKGADGLVHSGTTSFSGSNSGTIVGTFGPAVSIVAGGTRFVNHGLIESVLSGNTAVAIRSAAGVGVAGFDNFGTVWSSGSAFSGAFSSASLVRNFGDILGGISLGTAADTVLNQGRITGPVSLQSGDDRYDGRGGVASDSVQGGSGIDTLLGGAAGDLLFGGFDDDIVHGGGGADDLSGDADNDRLTGGSGDDIIAGGTGDDILQGQADDDTLNGGDGNDLLQGGDGHDSLSGDLGDDTVSGGAGDDTVTGADGADVLSGQAGDDHVIGGLGNDVLAGGAGDDTIEGNASSDRIIGGAGDDSLAGGGGGGADRFVFAQGHGNDRITDFQNDLDRIDLRAFGFASVAAVAANATNTPEGLQIDLTDHHGGTIAVVGLTVATLTVADLLL